jgi:MFS family permease
MISIYLFFLITENIDDSKEASLSSLMLTIGGTIELIFKLFSTYYGWVAKRKRALTIGMALFAIAVALNGYFQGADKWNLCKFAPFAFFPLIGGLITTSYYASLPEKFPQPVIGIVQGTTTLIWFTLSISFPFF